MCIFILLGDIYIYIFPIDIKNHDNFPIRACQLHTEGSSKFYCGKWYNFFSKQEDSYKEHLLPNNVQMSKRKSLYDFRVVN